MGISTLGDGPDKNGKGSFLLLDGETFQPKGTYPATDKDVMPFGYDYWYQPYHNVMISTEWGHPRCFFGGLDLADVEKGNYGTHLNVYDWKVTHRVAPKLYQTTLPLFIPTVSFRSL